MNLVILTGRMAKDPEIRYTESKKAVTSFSIAVDDGKSKDGTRRTQFVQCVAWEKTAELIDQYFKKGDPINITGKITSRSYEKDGSKRYITEVVVSMLEFPMSKKKEEKTEGFTEIPAEGELPF